MEKRTAELKADMQKRTAELQKQIDAKDLALQTERKQNSEKQLEIRRDAEKVQKEKNTEFTAKLTQLQADYSALVKTSKIAMQEQIALMEKQRVAFEITVTDQDG